MSFKVVGHGVAVPEGSLDKAQSIEIAKTLCHTDRQRRMVPVLYRTVRVKKRHSVLMERGSDGDTRPRYELMGGPARAGDLGPSTGARMKIYETEAVPLAASAARRAIRDGALRPGDITHLVTVSCSGFFAPGVDIALMKQLDLPPTVERAHVGFMGCQGALNGIRVARGIAESREESNVLLCAVELCSLHYHYSADRELMTANALFADGAAAIVGSNRPGADGWAVRDTGACLIPESQDSMTWLIRDNGFVMSLSPTVPSIIEDRLQEWLDRWLSDAGLTRDDIGTWAVHPGGPAILSAVEKALALPADALAVSKRILSEYGNMSSPTILFVLDELRSRGAALPCVAIAFGPGLMTEAVLFA
ncbi:MAG: type III polyketide synthase [Gemmatimonadetes bacterium]|nr:type III polyketide synthase [Gemmatimonadota bacterium]